MTLDEEDRGLFLLTGAWTLHAVGKVLEIHPTVVGKYVREGLLEGHKQKLPGRSRVLISPGAVVRYAVRRAETECAEAESDFAERLGLLEKAAARIHRRKPEASHLWPWSQRLTIGQATRALKTHRFALYSSIEQGTLAESEVDWTTTLAELRSYIEHRRDAARKHWETWSGWVERRVRDRLTYDEARLPTGKEQP